MGLSRQESIASSVSNQVSHRDSQADLTSYHDELEHLRIAKKQTDIKLQLLKKRYEDEASLFTDTRVNHIFKINGARDYLEKLNEKTRIKDEIIKSLKEDLESKARELKSLQDRCRDAEKRSREYMKAWKDSQMARDRLEMEKKTSPVVREAARLVNQSTANMSSASSFTDSPVPPPPPVDVPTIDEMLRTASTPRDQLSLNMSLDISIPPPPDVDVPLDELTRAMQPVMQQATSGGNDKRAFVQEQGQFLCHIYAAVDLQASRDTLSDIIELVEAEGERSSDGAFQDWSANIGGSDDELDGDDSGSTAGHRFHVTLVRGHRAIYYHQIGEMLSSIETQCNSSGAFRLCLDKLRLFNNHENTKQFLCMATRDDDGVAQSSVGEMANFRALKEKLRAAMDQFASRLTSEDETQETLAHCSLMSRGVSQPDKLQPETVGADLAAIESLCESNLDDYPVSLVQVDKIHIKIGNRIYEHKLAAY